VLYNENKSRGIFRPAGSPRIVQLPNPRLRELMADRAAWFVKKRDRNGNQKNVPAHPPEWAVSGVAARGNWKNVRYLEAVVESPTLRHDGTILDRPGWDRETGLLYEPRIVFTDVPKSPSRGDAEAAAERLVDLVVDFPFLGIEHRAAWLAS